MMKIHRAIVGYTGVEAGNMDERYGADALTNQEKLFQEIGTHRELVAIMKVQDADKIIDLGNEDVVKSGTFSCEALVTTNSKQALALFPADCLPLVLGSQTRPLLALVHVSRLSAMGGVVQKTIQHLVERYQFSPKDLYAYVGPSIKKSSYAFQNIDERQRNDARWSKYIAFENDAYHVDLLGYVTDKLVEAGISEKAISFSPIDTAGNSKYFSHYRDSRLGIKEARNGFIACLI